MKYFIFVIVTLIAFITITQGLSAQDYQDVVYLKNGSIVRGVIIEQIPGESLKIKTGDGSIFAYKMDEIEKITKEEVIKKKETLKTRKFQKKFNMIFYTGLFISDVSIQDPPPAVSTSSILLWHIGFGTEFDVNEYIRNASYLRFIRKGANDVYAVKGAYIIGNYLELENSFKFGAFSSPIKPYALISLAAGFKMGATGYSPSGASIDYGDYLTGTDFGLYFGGGADFPASRNLSVLAEVKYWLGLSDINDNAAEPSSVKTLGFQINFGLKFFF